MEDITVNATADGAEIEFNPYTCQTEEETFSLMGVVGGTIDEMTRQEYPSVFRSIYTLHFKHLYY